MTRKNPENKPLRIVFDRLVDRDVARKDPNYIRALGQLAIAQATMARHKASAMPHFIAIVKELEDINRFRFEQLPDV